jgi:galactose-6-phosphate isomerase
MPLLDVSEVLLDPDFQDSFTVKRQVQTVNDKGVVVLVPIISTQYGVVTMDDGTVAKRFPDLERVEGAILVHTKYRLTDGTISGLSTLTADIITWPVTNGREYNVQFVDNYSRYGDGFICAICTLRDLTNSPGS